MVISCKLCMNISKSKCQNIKVLYKSASQVPWMQNIYMAEWFLSLVWCHSCFQLVQRGMEHCKNNKRSTWALSRRARDRALSLRYIPKIDWNCVQSSWPPNPNGFTPQFWKKKCRDNTNIKEKNSIPVISRLQRAVNINKRNVQVESVGWNLPTRWEPHGSFTPLFTSQPEELAFSKSVSLRLHISASCPVFLFSLLSFSVPPPPTRLNSIVD